MKKRGIVKITFEQLQEALNMKNCTIIDIRKEDLNFNSDSILIKFDSERQSIKEVLEGQQIPYYGLKEIQKRKIKRRLYRLLREEGINK
jgi:hypothetical protein